ncbi:hypothetical protein IVB18_14915 [Bradyrhizobium sp. 186]|uniref:hypothetical protein n=1 Tax=Bradyrhizobium sp. 186 TaxID=2782654 RepID=UPI00200187EA|nr:hypothetical protein [Bradyrhizobium sp. 186]UPK38408.1 hypothetical protein IVB18_14915 [Bradyrhizobium sp. 186]
MAVRLDDQAAGRGAAQRGGGFVRHAHDRNWRATDAALVMGPQDVAELVELFGQRLSADAGARWRDHVLSAARWFTSIVARGRSRIIWTCCHGVASFDFSG